MAASSSVPPTTGSPSPRQRQRYRYRLPSKRKKSNPTKLPTNMRYLVALGILLLGLLITLVVIAFHLAPTDT